MRILTGTAGWADASLIRSGWYPPGTRTAADRLRYYASQFPLVEADAPYYALPSATTVAGWIDAAPDGFTMDVKAYSLFTGHRTRTATLPADLRTRVRGPWLTASSAPAGLVAELWHRFHQTFTPLLESGHLGLVLLQFPPQCRADAAGSAAVRAALRQCAPFPAAVEFRHSSWLEPEQRDRTWQLLRAHNAAYVCADMSQSHPGAVPALLAATANKAVIRLHGHSAAWSRGGKEERYRYEYSASELKAWADRSRRLGESVDEVHVVVNTCCAGTAQRAAAILRDQLDASVVATPGSE
ncbi:protein of unknown function DUF72 [Catenulispora acidiphila DSM 44928]|uniref:DUF72 domain-containing protein n=1 Tax=Catenulispora acidiphila (strain DSM 44928 / JCM 14897 / NBRC 102108 / NRRL B-24433 / ID139908) TaxID=479433 RepID=C7PYG7_CATAD|nr:DUF72 domain-containing protein [Catenulispora acidiphila]ACU75457.1 protein of unknown function DUF72 [Catenulispora acidiphila DSM 44928]